MGKICHPAPFEVRPPTNQLGIFKAIFLIPPYKITFENLDYSMYEDEGVHTATPSVPPCSQTSVRLVLQLLFS